jgi:hypothetical protein
MIGAYILMAFTMPAITAISSESAATINASANMSNFPGTIEMVNSAPVWLWFIPGLVGVVTTVIMLVKK